MADISPMAGLIQTIIQKQASILGMGVAVRRARNVAGLTIAESGTVESITASENKVLTDLVDQYKSLSGSVGADFCKQAALSYCAENSGMQLPAIFA